MIRFPLSDLLDEQECYDYLVRTLHPEGLCCRNGHVLPSGQSPHDCTRAPIVDYRCHICGNVFNVFTNLVWKGTHHPCTTIVLIMRGFVQGIPTLQLAEELEWAHNLKRDAFYLLASPPRGCEDSDARSSYLRRTMTKDFTTGHFLNRLTHGMLKLPSQS